jgi:hypothetical protein
VHPAQPSILTPCQRRGAKTPVPATFLENRQASACTGFRPQTPHSDPFPQSETGASSQRPISLRPLPTAFCPAAATSETTGCPLGILATEPHTRSMGFDKEKPNWQPDAQASGAQRSLKRSGRTYWLTRPGLPISSRTFVNRFISLIDLSYPAATKPNQLGLRVSLPVATCQALPPETEQH